MKDKSDLNTQLEIIEQFETLCASKSVSEFKERLGSQDDPGSFLAYMGNDIERKTSQAFDGFHFPVHSSCENDMLFLRLFLLTKKASAAQNLETKNHSSDPTSIFLFSAITAFQSLARSDYSRKEIEGGQADNTAIYVRQLIAHQKAAIIAAIAAIDETKSKPVAVANPLYAKLVTTGLMTSGLSLTGFSALMQFSPAFALLTGLQLPPVALIALAAVGALLISVAVYRLIKTNANAPKTVVETTRGEGAKQRTDTCVQSVYSYSRCCFKFGGMETEGNYMDTEKDDLVSSVIRV